jgi:hypothetical protein
VAGDPGEVAAGVGSTAVLFTAAIGSPRALLPVDLCCR